jgi:hypothetical protein
MRTYEDTLPTSMTPDKRRYRQLEIWQIPHDDKGAQDLRPERQWYTPLATRPQGD